MNVLCVVAHPDDEVLGAGATLHRHGSNGDTVRVVFLSDGVTSRHDEMTPEVKAELAQRKENAQTACAELGVDSTAFHEFPDNQFDTVALLDIVQTVEAEIDAFDPDMVYTHHHGDLNVDHELTSRAVLTAARPLPDAGVDRILAFDVLSSSEWATPTGDNTFKPTEFVDATAHVDAKLAALKAYDEELREHPHPRSVENVRRDLRLRGSQSGLDAAEAFEVLRTVRA
jgi:LmbE family N-acetylglucosaminyl deacetylase